MVLGRLALDLEKNKTGSLPNTKYKSGLWRMKDLNMKVKIMKLMEDNIGEYLCGLELDKNFLKPQKYIPYGKKDE